MEQIYTRAHMEVGITLKQMQNHRSIHGFDEETGDWNYVDGVCACSGFPSSMNFGGTGGGEEIVLFTGRWVEDIYDGVVVYPEQVVARYTTNEYERLVASGEIYEIYENDYQC